MLFSVKINKGLTGYLVTLSDITGIQKIAIQYGDMTLFEYSDQNDLPGEKSPIFDIPIADGKWHQFAFSVKKRHVTLYFDCDNIYEQHLSRSKHSTLGNNLMFSVGPYFARYGAPFEVSRKNNVQYENTIRTLLFQNCYYTAKKGNLTSYQFIFLSKSATDCCSFVFSSNFENGIVQSYWIYS
jgi:hypothetical protein